MKTILRLLTIIFLFAGTTFNPNRAFTQNCINVVGSFSGPSRYEVQAPAGNFLCITTGPGTCPPVAGTLTMPGMGINQSDPKYMLDVLCAPGTKNDINISNASTNAVGYRIGGNMVMWHDGDPTSFYLGVGSGFKYNGILPNKRYYNTFVGYNVGGAFRGNGGIENTAMGYLALTNNKVSDGNTSIGAYALTSFASTKSNYNVAVGWSALKTYNPITGRTCVAVGEDALENETTNGDNVAIGSSSQHDLDTGSGNTAVGNYSLQNNLVSNNTAMGYNAMANNTTGRDNTAVGWYALQGAPNMGSDNTAIGAQALQSNATGNDNTAIGQAAMWKNSKGSNNTAIGMWALYNNTSNPNGCGSFNVGLGQGSLFNNYANSNTATGYYSGYNTTSGGYNTADGFESMYGIVTGAKGNYNDASGTYSLYSLSSGDSNVSAGAYSLYRNTDGNANAALGYNAGLSVKSDFDNLFLGARADKNNTNSIHNAAAIGYFAVTTATNQMELGNNNNDVTMGLSNKIPGNPTRLEINTQYGSSPFNVNSGSIPPTYVNGGAGTGWSGLRFDDLKSGSIPGNNPGPGVLALDGAGNVIYVKDSMPTNTNGIGTCANPTILSNTNGAIDMANVANFYFLGNSSGIHLNDVAIGLPPCISPNAKLDILQSSGADRNSIGLSVINTDNGSTSCDVYSTPNVIGIKCFLPNISGGAKTPAVKVGGWFEVQSAFNCSNFTQNQYAIFVPDHGGNVSIGFKWNAATFAMNYYPLMVDGPGANIGGNFTASDSTIKTNVQPLVNALQIIKNLKGVSYDYIPDVIVGPAMDGMHYGFIAQQVARVLPSAVKQIPNPVDSAPLVGLSYNDIIPWLVEAIKEQEKIKHSDSLNGKHKNDSLLATVKNLHDELDSLRSAVQSMQSCINGLCLDKHASVQNDASNNVQNITLSSANAPLLYQNSPNPFSTGTKIKYYLPEGTVEAVIVFYDSYGNQIKTVELNQTGQGELNITPDNLSNGIYSYSLIVNSNEIDTKRMIIQK